MNIEPLTLSESGTLEERVEHLERYIYRLVQEIQVLAQDIEETAKPAQEEKYRRRLGL